MIEKEEKMIEKEEKKYKLEYKRFMEWTRTILLIDKGEILNLLLFKINENLDKITESISGKDLKF